MAGQLLRNLLLFGRLLRGLGLDVNPGRLLDVFHALPHVEIGHRSDFYHTLRSLLVHRREDQPLFDQAFALFWRAPRERWEVRLAGLAPSAVDTLYFTGGSTGLVPLVDRIGAEFGAARVVRGDRFASVAHGLGVHARRVFGAPVCR